MASQVTWPVLVVTIYCVFMVFIGYLSRIRERTVSEYFVAGRTIGVIATFFGSYLTLQSAFIFMGMGALGFLMGAPAYIIALCGSAHSAIILFVWPKIWALGKEHGWITQADYLAERYESPVFMKIVPPLLAIVSIMIGHLMIQIVAMGYIFQVATKGQLPYAFGVFYSLAFLIIYVVVGGFRATAWTNIVQGIWATIAMLAIIFVFLSKLGMGVGEGFMALAAKEPKLLSPPGGVGYFTWPMIISWLFIYAFTAQTFPHQFTRAYATAHPKIFPVVAAAWVPANIVFTLPVLLVGTLARNLWANPAAAGVAKPDQIIPKIVTDLFNPWLVPVILVGAVAAAMSTADGATLTISGMVSKDWFKSLIKKDASDVSVLWVGRLFVIIVAVISGLLALFQTKLITSILTAAYAIVSPLFVPLMAGLFWPRLNKHGAIVGILGGEAIAILQVFIQGYGDKAAWFGFQASFWAIITSFILTVLVSYLTPPPSETVRNKFFTELKYPS